MRESLVLGNSDVIVMADGRRITAKTSRTCEVMGEVVHRLSFSIRTTIQRNSEPNFIEWVTQGIEAEVISTDSEGWVKGKVRLCLEFIPDPEPEPEAEEVLIPKEPESPLDEFRQKEIESEEVQLKRLESLLDKISQQV